MPRVTRFPIRASTAERMGDFTRHLRENGLPVGMPETELALRSMVALDIGRPEELRMALKAICAADSKRTAGSMTCSTPIGVFSAYAPGT